VSPPTILIVPNPNNAIVPSSAVGTTNAIQTLPNANLADGPHENNMIKVKINNINWNDSGYFNLKIQNNFFKEL
jgi:hypothetical protein